MKRILGDYRAFFADLLTRLDAAGIDVSGRPLSHIAYRTGTMDEYRRVRRQILVHCDSEVENVWNGRPIGKLLLREPLPLDASFDVSLIELIPPKHQRTYPMGLEHVGFVLGDEHAEFAVRHRDVLTEQQDQGPWCQPWVITFRNNRSVKFYREGLKEVVEREGRRFLPLDQQQNPA